MGGKAKPVRRGVAATALLSLAGSATWVVKKTHTGAEQPFDTVVDGHAPGEAPQPLTLNHPASNPGCSSGWGSFFLGHRNAAKMIPGLS
jgi:hypothetical protein